MVILYCEKKDKWYNQYPYFVAQVDCVQMTDQGRVVCVYFWERHQTAKEKALPWWKPPYAIDGDGQPTLTEKLKQMEKWTWQEMERIFSVTDHYNHISDDPTSIALWFNVNQLMTHIPKAKRKERAYVANPRSEEALTQQQKLKDNYRLLMEERQVKDAVEQIIQKRKALATRRSKKGHKDDLSDDDSDINGVMIESKTVAADDDESSQGYIVADKSHRSKRRAKHNAAVVPEKKEQSSIEKKVSEAVNIRNNIIDWKGNVMNIKPNKYTLITKLILNYHGTDSNDNNGNIMTTTTNNNINNNQKIHDLEGFEESDTELE